MQTLDKHRFIGLEWLRFLMGFYVVVYHTIHFYPERKTIPLLDEITSMGFFATSTFFVLSGFLLAHVYCGRGSLREPARSFWVKRFANLYPIHIFALLLAMAVVTWIGSLGIPPGAATASIRFVVFDTNEPLARTHPELFQHFMSNAELAFNAVLQLFMLQAWNPYYLTFNAPLWSISALFFFYLTFPKLAPRLMTSERPWQLLLLVWVLYLIPPLLVILHQNYGMPFTGLLQRVPLFRLPEFLAGILLYAIFRRQHARGWIPSAAAAGELPDPEFRPGHGAVHPWTQVLVLPVPQRAVPAVAADPGLSGRAGAGAGQRTHPPLVATTRRCVAVDVRPARAPVGDLHDPGAADRRQSKGLPQWRSRGLHRRRRGLYQLHRVVLAVPAGGGGALRAVPGAAGGADPQAHPRGAAAAPGAAAAAAPG